jgi:hypothetical protein
VGYIMSRESGIIGSIGVLTQVLGNMFNMSIIHTDANAQTFRLELFMIFDLEGARYCVLPQHLGFQVTP